jgi:UDP-3-O-[3-hydroxymyristoyl] N-acetylglucosamine deacetylase / 3-hydroxyacyl-[acyl-carrier-protein] dehydratase
MLTARRLQRTIAQDTEVQGVGFLQGHDVALRFRPALADAGIVFVRTDLPGNPRVRAHIDNVVPSQRRTTIRDGEAVVEMVEHVMAALAGLQIDNCRIEINAPETPGCDGSSLAFTEALSAAGTIELDRPREVLVIDRPVTVRDGAAVVTAYPGGGEGYVLAYQLDYGRGNPIGAQSRFVELSPESFTSEIAGSRTFLLQSEAETLRAAGVGRRTTEADLLIFGPDGVIGNTLRFADECARHKILDLIGDLSLLGADIVGHVVAHRSGHALNAALVRELIALDAGMQTVDDDMPFLRMMPQRSPFPMVDAVLALEPGRSIAAVKNVTMNEPYLSSPRHGPAVLPAVLLIEALAQAAGLMLADPGLAGGSSFELFAIDRVCLPHAVHPADQVHLEVSCRGQDASGTRAVGVATVDGRVVAEAAFQFVRVKAERPAA